VAALVGVVLATALRVALDPILGSEVPFILFFPLIAAIAWFLGVGPGRLATGLCAVAAVIFIMPPYGTLALARPDILVALTLFTGIGLFLCTLISSLATSRRRAEAERATLKATLLSIGDGVIVSDRDGRVTLMNPVAEQLTGWTLTRASGRPVSEVFRIASEATRVPAEDPIARVLRNGFAVGAHGQTLLRSTTGEEWPIDESGAPIRDSHEETVGAVLVFRQVSEQRRLEAARAVALAREHEARVEAEAVNRTKDEFLATLSHELRTPLNAILGWARMLADPGAYDAHRRHAVMVIQRNAEAQNALIGDLLDMSRFMTGKMRLSFQSVRFADVIDDAIDAIRVAAEAKQIGLDVALDRTLGPIAGDPDRLRQLVWNLLLNAVKFTPKSGRISVALAGADSHATLRVTDNGVGIAPDLMPRIFDRFTQGDASMSRAHGGLGLGLALVKQIAEAHGGVVVAESDGPGTGAEFRVALPIFLGEMQVPRASPSSDDRHPDAATEPLPSLQGVRILLVEDDEDGRQLIELLLLGCGAEVRSTASVSGALGILEGWHPHAIVTDIGMPGEDGFSLLQTLRVSGREGVPIIALTGYATPGDRARILEAGFVRHVSKPVDIRELVDVILSATAPV